MKRILITICIAAVASLTASAQRVSVSTNLIDWAYLVTPNVALQYAVSQHISLEAQAKYNAWSFRTGGSDEERSRNEMKTRQQCYNLGVRWWPWNSFSGWWVSAAVQFQEYDNGGVGFIPWLPDNEAGEAYGGGLAAGYSLQVHKHWNVDFGLGLWGGYKHYTTYECPWCGRTTGKGGKTFLAPDRATIALMYIF